MHSLGLQKVFVLWTTRAAKWQVEDQMRAGTMPMYVAVILLALVRQSHSM